MAFLVESSLIKETLKRVRTHRIQVSDFSDPAHISSLSEPPFVNHIRKRMAVYMRIYNCLAVSGAFHLHLTLCIQFAGVTVLQE